MAAAATVETPALRKQGEDTASAGQFSCTKAPQARLLYKNFFYCGIDAGSEKCLLLENCKTTEKLLATFGPPPQSELGVVLSYRTRTRIDCNGTRFYISSFHWVGNDCI